MRRRTLLLLIMLAVPLLNSAAQAQSPVTDQAILTGGSYRLITDGPQLTGGISSARYRLLPAASAADEGCCCKAHLPCIVK